MTRTIAQVISWAALVWTVVAPILFWADVLTLDATKLHLIATMVAWFVATPLWMGREAKAPVTSPAGSAP